MVIFAEIKESKGVKDRSPSQKRHFYQYYEITGKRPQSARYCDGSAELLLGSF